MFLGSLGCQIQKKNREQPYMLGAQWHIGTGSYTSILQSEPFTPQIETADLQKKGRETYP